MKTKELKQKAQQLEHFLEEEFSKKLPLAVLKNNDVVYKGFVIKQNKEGKYLLTYATTGDTIDEFRLKATAILAAKFFETNQFQRLNEIKILDTGYWQNFVDSSFFKERVRTTADLDKRDMYLWRWEITRTRTRNYKEEISRMFRHAF